MNRQSTYYIRAYADILPFGNHDDLATIQTTEPLADTVLRGVMHALANDKGVALHGVSGNWATLTFSYIDSFMHDIPFRVVIVKKKEGNQ